MNGRRRGRRRYRWELRARTAGTIAFQEASRVSIDVILRQGECVADESDLGGVLARGEDFDDVEAEADVGIVEETEPGHGASGYAALFVIVDGVGGASAFLAGPGLHFDEDEGLRFFVAANEIDFTAAGRDEIAVEDAVALAAKVFLGLTLAPLSEDDVAGQGFRPRTAFAPPVEKTGDGRGWGHGIGGLRGARAHHSLCGGRSHTADTPRRARS